MLHVKFLKTATSKFADYKYAGKGLPATALPCIVFCIVAIVRIYNYKNRIKNLKNR